MQRCTPERRLHHLSGIEICLSFVGMIQVVCAIIERGGYVLAARRGPDMRHPWKWEFPGGKVEAGESPKEALKRELAEELSVRVDIIEALPPVKYDYPDLSIELCPFRCEWTGGEPLPDEHAETVWMDPAGLLSLDFAEADVIVAEAYMAKFQGGGHQTERPLF